MLRSCLAMMLSGQTSFDERVGLMRDDPFYALISSFEPDDVPGVGTFYDFQARLLGRVKQGRSQLRGPYLKRDERDQAKQHQDRHDLRPHPGIVERLAERIPARPEPLTSLAGLLEGYGDLSPLQRQILALLHLPQTIFDLSFIVPLPPKREYNIKVPSYFM